MATKQDRESGQTPVSSIATVSYWLTPAEQESLRQDLKDANAYFKKAFTQTKPVNYDTSSRLNFPANTRARSDTKH